MSGRERDGGDAFVEGLGKLVGAGVDYLAREFRDIFDPPAPAGRDAEAPTPARPLCSEDEGGSGVRCMLAEGHPLPHEGWHRHGADTTGQYATVVRWPIPDRPAHLGGVPNAVACRYCGEPIERARRTWHGQQWEHYRTGWPSCDSGGTPAMPPVGLV